MSNLADNSTTLNVGLKGNQKACDFLLIHVILKSQLIVNPHKTMGKLW